MGVNALVTLDGSGSTDPDEDALTYVWGQVAGSRGRVERIKGYERAKPTFTAPSTPTDGLVYKLTVKDSVGQTDEDTVTVKVVGPPAALQEPRPREG